MGTPAPGCNGTVFNILKQGAGAEVTKGAKVTVHATGVVQETGKKFWSTKDAGQEPFSYQAGVGQARLASRKDPPLDPTPAATSAVCAAAHAAVRSAPIASECGRNTRRGPVRR